MFGEPKLREWMEEVLHNLIEINGVLQLVIDDATFSAISQLPTSPRSSYFLQQKVNSRT